jgi:aldehyde dehydrogenase (NAD+)
VAAARAAFKAPSWRDLPGSQRGDLLYKLASLIEQHKETLATIETWDNGRLSNNNWSLFLFYFNTVANLMQPVGKPYKNALNDDLAEVHSCIRYYAGYADKIHGQVMETTPMKLAYTLREPIGVCGQIIP